MSQNLGATAIEWVHFDLVLGLGADLLPVVCDPHATPSPNSKVKAFGKIPSVYDGEGYAVGLAGWQTREIAPANIERWSGDRRLALCVRASAVRAIDVDVTDAVKAAAIRAEIPTAMPVRTRTNSPKFLCAFRLPYPQRKRIIKCGEAGRIELLADGQQWLAAGSHPSGARYEWDGGLPGEFPILTPAELDALWKRLAARFGEGEQPQAAVSDEGDGEGETLTEIGEGELSDLRDALKFPPLIDACHDGEGLPSDNELWTEVGYSLLSLGALGEGLWREFGATVKGANAGAVRYWWDSHCGGQPRSDWRHILTLARARGWRMTAPLEAFPVVPPSTDASLLAPPPERPVLRLASGQLHEYALAAERILAPDLFTQAGRLVRVTSATELDDGALREAAQLVPVVATPEWIERRLTAVADIVKFDKRAKAWLKVNCPKDLSVNITGQKDWPAMRRLEAIARAPFLRRDGSVCETPGYDEATGVLYAPSGAFGPIPHSPTPDDAKAALEALMRPFEQFPYGSDAMRAAFAAHILTEAGRIAANPVPMFWYTAPTAGTGKTLLAAMAALLVHGNEPSIRPWVKDGDELRKTLFSSLLAGDRSVTFDNIPNGEKVRSAELCRFLTTHDTYKDRRLGESQVLSARNLATVVGSGNNVTPVGDLARRSLVIRLDANTPNLRERTFAIDNLRAYVVQHRRELLPYALTIIRAYILCGEHGPTPLPSFEDWSRLVRDPLLWLGMADPVESQVEETDDESQGSVSAFEILGARFAGREFTARDIIDAAQSISDQDGTLLDAMMSAGCSEPTNAVKVGFWLRDKRGSIASGYKLERGALDGSQKWRLRNQHEDLL